MFGEGFGFALMGILVMINRWESDRDNGSAYMADFHSWNGNTFGRDNVNNSNLPWDPKL